MKEALKLALEWAESHGEIVFAGGGMGAVTRMNAWAVVVKEALAQPEQLLQDYAAKNPLGGPAKIFDAMAACVRAGDSFKSVLAAFGFAEVTPDHIPDAGKMVDHLTAGGKVMQQEQEPWMCRIWNDKDAQWRLTDDCSWPAEPVYTTPQKRPWVGLTDEDIAYAYTLEKKFAMQYVDAKLKELNT